ncbi:MAG: AbrB/MazE/SpoVT family DNA-binding domain-containing protein [Thermofilum sp.]
MEEVVATRKYQVTIPKAVREKLDIKVGDRLSVRVFGGSIVLEPEKALERLRSIASRLLGGPQRVDAVKLVEGSLGR